MCGRATYKLTWEEIVALYRLTLGQPAVNTRARYNVCPTTTIDTIVGPDDKRELVRMRWGLIPSWWSKPLKELSSPRSTHGPRQSRQSPCFDRLSTQPLPNCGIRLLRWQDTPGGKQPWYFTARDGSPALTIAGLWDEWQDKEKTASRSNPAP